MVGPYANGPALRSIHPNLDLDIPYNRKMDIRIYDISINTIPTGAGTLKIGVPEITDNSRSLEVIPGEGFPNANSKNYYFVKDIFFFHLSFDNMISKAFINFSFSFGIPIDTLSQLLSPYSVTDLIIIPLLKRILKIFFDE